MNKVVFIVIAVVVLVGLASAQVTVNKYPNIGFKKIGVKLGPAIPDSPYNVGFVFDISGDLGKLNKVIGLEATAEYMRVTKTVLETYTNSLSDFSGNITIKILPDIESIPFDPYVGGGIGFHYYMTKLDERQSGATDEPADTRLELHLAIGATMPIKEGIDGVFTFKVNLSDISTYNPYVGVMFDM